MKVARRPFWAFVRKEFLQIFRDKRTMLILLVMPIVLILIFGYAVTAETKNTKVAFVDMSKDEITRAIVNRVTANPNFVVVEASTTDMRRVDELFARGEAHLVVVFAQGFADNFKAGAEPAIQILADGSEPNQATVRTTYLQQILRDELSSRVSALGPARAGYRIDVANRMLFNPMMRSEYNFVPGVIGIIVILICAMMTSIAIVREKELGTMEVLLASPLPPSYIITAKLLPYFVIALINLVTILAISRFVIGIPIAGSFVALITISVIYILVALALGLLISSLANSQLTAMLISLLLIVPSVYFSDLVFPIESMPVPLNKIPNAIPTRWYIQAARRLMVQGVGLGDVLKEIAILSVMAVAFMAIAWKSFKTRL